MATHSSTLAWKIPWMEESDTTERLHFHFHFSLSCIGEGHGNPLQCSCLKSPRDRGAWWVAVYGVAQSWTRLKWLSSSSRVLTKSLNLLGLELQSYLLWGGLLLKSLLSSFRLSALFLRVAFSLAQNKSSLLAKGWLSQLSHLRVNLCSFWSPPSLSLYSYTPPPISSSSKIQKVQPLIPQWRCVFVYRRLWSGWVLCRDRGRNQ